MEIWRFWLLIIKAKIVYRHRSRVFPRFSLWNNGLLEFKWLNKQVLYLPKIFPRYTAKLKSFNFFELFELNFVIERSLKFNAPACKNFVWIILWKRWLKRHRNVRNNINIIKISKIKSRTNFKNKFSIGLFHMKCPFLQKR